MNIPLASDCTCPAARGRIGAIGIEQRAWRATLRGAMTDVIAPEFSARCPSVRGPPRPVLRRPDMTFFRRFTDNATLKALGPGLITGAADDDPSGIATYSQAGAQFGLNTLWTLVLTYPFMVGIQLVSARIGRVTGLGLAANIRRA
jgi:hypothetical protein